MRLPDERFARLSVLAVALALTGCGALGGGDRPANAASEAGEGAPQFASGPAADYPMVLGEPFAIDGMEYVPADRMNFDEVGYATIDAEGGISASHKTLPLPSYVEVTSLESGKTILVRVERRGPMTGTRLVGLSAGAQAQLGSTEGTPVRVRRVNPPEIERAALRAGQPAPERLATPMSLVDVLKRKLPAAGSLSLAKAEEPEDGSEARPDTPREPAQIVVAIPNDIDDSVTKSDEPAQTPSVAVVAAVRTEPKEAPKPKPEARSGIVIQAATFSNETNAKKAAKSIDGFVVPAGRFFRVRTGPYSDRGKANAALAKVKAAGYSDARVIDAG